MTYKDAIFELNDMYDFDEQTESNDAIEMAIEALEREKIYKSTLFKIGETLVDESKLHITSEKACEQILEYLKQQDVKLWKLKEVNNNE